jgi:DNA-binding transcriptional regulator YiaG
LSQTGERWTPRRVRTLRKELGVSQTAFGEIVGVSLRQVQYWETGERPPTTLHQNALTGVQTARRSNG